MRILTTSAFVLASALALAACTTSNTIDGHQVRADGQAVTTTTYSPAIASAPQWFKDYWREYLRSAEGSYTVMAVDRNLRGAYYVYCQGGDCHNLIGNQHRTFKDVRYKGEAREKCREWALREFPGQKPDCEIFAIRDKIVWEGPMPWE